MPGSTRSTDGRSNLTKDAPSGTRMTRSQSGRAAPPPPLPKVSEDPSHLSTPELQAPISVVSYLSTPVMTSPPRPTTGLPHTSSSTHVLPTPSTADSACGFLDRSRPSSSSPASERTSPSPTRCLMIDTSSSLSRRLEGVPSPTAAPSLPHPTASPPLDRPAEAAPTSDPDGDSMPTTSSTSGTLLTVTSSATRAHLPQTVFNSPPRLVTTQQKKVVFTNIPDVPVGAFYSALRTYRLDEHIRQFVPLTDGSGYIITCSSSRIAEQILNQPLPAALARGTVRPPLTQSATSQRQSSTVELILHDIALHFTTADIKTDLESRHSIKVSYINRIHQRRQDGTIDFDSPARHVRVRMSEPESRRLTRQSTITLFEYNHHRYTVTGTFLPISQCRRCFSFEHQTVECNRPTRCSKCNSTAHLSGSCPQDAPTCANCSGAHRPTYQGCPLYKAASRRQRVRRPTSHHAMQTNSSERGPPAVQPLSHRDPPSGLAPPGATSQVAWSSVLGPLPSQHPEHHLPTLPTGAVTTVHPTGVRSMTLHSTSRSVDIPLQQSSTTPATGPPTWVPLTDVSSTMDRPSSFSRSRPARPQHTTSGTALPTIDLSQPPPSIHHSQLPQPPGPNTVADLPPPSSQPPPQPSVWDQLLRFARLLLPLLLSVIPQQYHAIIHLISQTLESARNG